MPILPALKRLSQGDCCEMKTSLYYKTRPYLKKRKGKERKGREREREEIKKRKKENRRTLPVRM